MAADAQTDDAPGLNSFAVHPSNPAVNKLLRCSLLTVALVAFATGCSYYDSHTITYLGSPRPAPTDPGQVKILQSPPTRPHDRLGEIVVDASLDPPPDVAKVEDRFRREAAKLGADAVVVVSDRAETTGWWMTGPYWSPSVSNMQSRIIVGVAIKYRPAQ